MGLGRFIAFEGGEGCGKSTQAARLAKQLGALLTRQPGGTGIGAQLRTLLLSSESGSLDARAEALLMAADRAQHVAELIRPALDGGRDVVCDRYTGSSVAYQGYGRGLDPQEIARMSGWATDGLWPDLVVLLTLDPAVAAARVGADLDRFESAGMEFHERVSHGFDVQALADPVRWAVVDGSGSIDEVALTIDAVVAERFGR